MDGGREREKDGGKEGGRERDKGGREEARKEERENWKIRRRRPPKFDNDLEDLEELKNDT